MTDPNDDNLSLEIYGILLDAVEALPAREQKLAALRCFGRGLRGQDVLEGNREILKVKL